MTESKEHRFAQHLQRISDLNELIGQLSCEWKNLKITCPCDAKKGEACSICEIDTLLNDWQRELDAEGPQE